MQRETLNFCLQIPNWDDRHTPVVTMGKHTKAGLSVFFALDIKCRGFASLLSSFHLSHFSCL